MSRTKRPSKTKGKGRPQAKAAAKGNRRPAPQRDALAREKRRERLAEYLAAVESANVNMAMGLGGRGILDVDPTEFGLPEDYDDGDRYFAHAMAKDD